MVFGNSLNSELVGHDDFIQKIRVFFLFLIYEKFSFFACSFIIPSKIIRHMGSYYASAVFATCEISVKKDSSENSSLPPISAHGRFVIKRKNIRGLPRSRIGQMGLPEGIGEGLIIRVLFSLPLMAKKNLGKNEANSKADDRKYDVKKKKKRKIKTWFEVAWWKTKYPFLVVGVQRRTIDIAPITPEHLRLFDLLIWEEIRCMRINEGVQLVIWYLF